MSRELFSEFETVADSCLRSPSTTACQTGDVTELKLCLELRSQGCEIFSPFGHATKIDIIVITPSKRVVRVQVKTATKVFHKEGRAGKGKGSPRWYVNTCQVRTRHPTNGTPRFTHRRALYNSDDFDVLAVYSREHDMFLFYPSNETCQRTGLSLGASHFKAELQRWDMFS